MEHKINQLRNIFWGLFSFAVSVALAVEFIFMDIIGGIMAGDAELEFIVQSFMSLSTLGGIYIALRFFKLKFVERAIQEDPYVNYNDYAAMRTVILMGLVVFNFICYLLFANSSFVWLGIMAGLAFPFVYPSLDRYRNETHLPDDIDADASQRGAQV